jgi:hypothetical protein
MRLPRSVAHAEVCQIGSVRQRSGMKLFAAELAYIRSQGVYITEKCDACGKILN